MISRYLSRSHRPRKSLRPRHSSSPLASAAAQTAQAAYLAEPLESRLLLAADIHVDLNAPGPNHDGTTWDYAFTDLQLALTAAVSGTRILVADGTYKPTTTINRNMSFRLKNGVQLLGGCAGYGAPNPDARDIAGYPTILSGDIGVAGSTTDNSYHVLLNTGCDSTAVLDGFTITGGNANGSGVSALGGGMYDSASSPTLTNCTFSGNSATSGGGMYNTASSSPTLTNCTFSGNSATSGGGMYNTGSSSPTLNNCTCSGNSATQYGGGIYDTSSSPTLVNCTLYGNSAASGGGMYNTSSSSPTLTNCTVSGNSASAPGGGIYGNATLPTLKNVIVAGNTAPANPDLYGSLASGTNYNLIGVLDASQKAAAGAHSLSGTAGSPLDPKLGTPVTINDLLVVPPFSNSPAVNAGSNALAVDASGHPLTTDEVGNPRIAGGTVDVGAVEYTVPTIYVDLNAPGPTHDGTSWTYAYTDLQQALTAAVSGDRILVADGTYKPTSTTTRTMSFTLKNGVQLLGGYAGYGAHNPDAKDIAAYPTTLAGTIGAVGGNTNYSYHVVTSSNCDSTAVLDGFTITCGNADGASSGQSYGGGMYNTSSSPTLNNCTFRGNSAGSGGAMYNTSSSPTLNNCTFTDNSAGSGGAMYNTSSAPALNNCTFSNNSFTSNGGGGMYNASSSPTLSNCTFSGNSATSGGGMYNTASSSPTLTNCTFSGNSATSGGGMYNTGSSSPTLNNCTFVDNGAGSGAGMYNSNTSAPTLTNCTFSNNWATNGGGMYNSSSSPTLTTCAFSSNSASAGGGVYNDSYSSPALTNCIISGSSAGTGAGMYDFSSSPTVTNCVFSGNSAWSCGGGMYNSTASSPKLTNCTFSGNSTSGIGAGMYNTSSSPTLTNCILWNDTALACPEVYNEGTTPAITYSDVQGGWVGAGNINADPRFLRNSSAGLDGIWGTADDDDGDVRISPTSPAVDAGKNAAVPRGITTDLVGAARFQDVPTSAHSGSGTTPIVDMGAYEAIAALAAAAGGPYIVLAGQSLTLNASGASAQPGALQYAWEWSGDGRFDDASGPSPVFFTAGLPANSTVTIAVRVTDTAGQSITSSTTLKLVPAVVYVDANATGTNDGTSWANAFTTLTAALSAAPAGLGQELRVADGTYKPTATKNRATPFQLKNGLAIRGGYAGFGASNPDARDVAAYSTILSGDIGVVGSISDNSYHVVSSAGCDATAILDGFTISGGNANGGGSASSFGSGMYNYASSPTLTNCTFDGNSATNVNAYAYGGGMYNASSSPALSNCVFTGNVAGSAGGGLYNASSSPTLSNCVFTGNVAGSAGGGLYNASSSPTLTNCSFSGNAAPSGGGLYNSSSSPALTSCTFSGNRASSNHGGGVYNASSSPAVTNCTFSGNSASQFGGGIYNNSSSPTLSNCSFTGNTTGISGAGLYNSSSSPTLSSCAFTGNSANINGGGMYNSSSSPILNNCTFRSNSAGNGGGAYNNSTSWLKFHNCTFNGNLASITNGAGGGMYNDCPFPMLTNCTFSGNSANTGGGMYNSPSSWPTLKNTLIAGNTAATSADLRGSLLSGSDYNLIGVLSASQLSSAGAHTLSGTAASPLDPMLGTPVTINGLLIYPLLPGSPAINAGSNALAVDAGGNPLTTDEVGNPRITGGIVDIGAVEYQPQPLSLAGTSSDDSVTLTGDANTLSWKINSAPTLTLPRSLATSLQFALGPGNDTLTIAASTFTFDTDLSAAQGNLSLSLTGGSSVTFTASQHLAALSIDSTSTLTLAPNGHHYLQIGTTANPATPASLNLAPGATLDVNDNGLIVQCADAANRDAVTTAIFNLIAHARGADPLNLWAGDGIRSSTAMSDPLKITTVGIRSNQGILPSMQLRASFKGAALRDRFSVLAGYTYNGDTNLDGVVNGTDYTNILAGYIAHKSGWCNGDFNYDGAINGSDYTVLNAAYCARASNSTSAIPMAQTAAPASIATPAALSNPAPAPSGTPFNTQPLPTRTTKVFATPKPRHRHRRTQ